MRKKILVVDDNRLMREFMANLLQTRGMEVSLAENGFEALDILTSFRPDIIFIDLVMPKIDGGKLCRIIRNMAHLDECYLVVISAAAAEMGDDFKEFGADACIAKGAFDQMAKHVLAVIELAQSKDDTGKPILGTEKIQPRQMTRELLRRKQHLESIVDSISDGIIETYADRVVSANPAAAFLFSQSPESLIGLSFPGLFSEKVRPHITSLMVAANVPPPGTVNTTIPSSHGDRFVVVKRLPMVTEDDTRLFLLTDMTKLKKADEKIQKTHQKQEEKVALRTADLTRTNQQLNQEISERKKTATALIENQKLFNQFMQHTPSIAFIKDLKGRYVYVNESYQKLFGLDLHSCIGKTDDELWPPEIAQKLKENDELVITLNEAIVKVEVIKINDETHHQLVSKFPILKDGQPSAVGGCAVDITRRVQAEEDRSKLIEKLQGARKMEALGSLAGGVAHDLSNILSGIVSYPELMLLDLDERSPLRKPLVTIKKAAERAAATVQDLMVLAKRDMPVKKVVNLNDRVDQYRQNPEHAKILDDHPDLKITTSLEPHLHNISGSPVRLEKMIAHLVTNAAGAVLGSGHIHLETENIHFEKPPDGSLEIPPGDYVSLTVADSGCALDPKQRERIFEPFFTNKVLGRNDTGLGMAVVWGTVNDHKGRIELRATDAGNTFVLYFPAIRDEPAR